MQELCSDLENYILCLRKPESYSVVFKKMTFEIAFRIEIENKNYFCLRECSLFSELQENTGLFFLDFVAF